MGRFVYNSVPRESGCMPRVLKLLSGMSNLFPVIRVTGGLFVSPFLLVLFSFILHS